MKSYHRLENLNFRGNWLLLTIDGEEKKFPLQEISPTLAGASDRERNNFEVSPSGYGIHWPSLDEDLSIDGLLGIVHSPGFQKKSA
ncbi:MAG: DUF2442 domain-containing protein [Deltaproteobacteria bacterium]|nr:DUF2442 domain-containing protein [Deltaproteobacteria bacterium]